MGTFDPHYAVEIKKSISTEYKKNKFIDKQMVYVIDDDKQIDQY